MTATESARQLAQIAATAANNKKGQNILAFDVSESLAITDIFLIVSANNERQVAAIVDAVEEAMIERADTRSSRREGERDNRWVLLDFVDLVVHVQHDEDRALYSLERLWKDCPRVPLELDDVVLTEDDVDEEMPLWTPANDRSRNNEAW